MLISAFGLMVAVMINGDVYESVPFVFDTKQECLAYEKTVTKDYYEKPALKGRLLRRRLDSKQ